MTMAVRVVAVVMQGLDRRRFPCVKGNWEPSEAQRNAAVLALLNPTIIRGIVASRSGLSRYALGGKAVESGTGSGFVECWP